MNVHTEWKTILEKMRSFRVERRKGRSIEDDDQEGIEKKEERRRREKKRMKTCDEEEATIFFLFRASLSEFISQVQTDSTGTEKVTEKTLSESRISCLKSFFKSITKTGEMEGVASSSSFCNTFNEECIPDLLSFIR
jgi:hypothetical protein